MFQEIHSSSVPVPIHFKVEDGDFVFLNSFCLGTVKTVFRNPSSQLQDTNASEFSKKVDRLPHSA